MGLDQGTGGSLNVPPPISKTEGVSLKSRHASVSFQALPQSLAFNHSQCLSLPRLYCHRECKIIVQLMASYFAKLALSREGPRYWLKQLSWQSMEH